MTVTCSVEEQMVKMSKPNYSCLQRSVVDEHHRFALEFILRVYPAFVTSIPFER